jgi:hypothetical protein
MRITRLCSFTGSLLILSGCLGPDEAPRSQKISLGEVPAKPRKAFVATYPESKVSAVEKFTFKGRSIGYTFHFTTVGGRWPKLE